jgi:hypothetical protein
LNRFAAPLCVFIFGITIHTSISSDPRLIDIGAEKKRAASRSLKTTRLSLTDDGVA